MAVFRCPPSPASAPEQGRGLARGAMVMLCIALNTRTTLQVIVSQEAPHQRHQAAARCSF